MLVLATVGWGLSFPVTKALLLMETLALPGRASWLYSGALLAARFAVAAVLVVIMRPGAVRHITRLEWEQGLGLGVIGGLGILFQTDGLHFTQASTSAFLTQFYCMLLPLVAAIQNRRAPRPLTMLCCAMVLAGVGILSGMDWRTFQLGRGEIETLIAATIFTAQIWWLNRARFAGTDPLRMSLVMFGSTALVLWAAALPHAHRLSDLLVPFASWPTTQLLLVLAVVCTLFAYGLMNWWQPLVDATRAGLIYCCEPIFTSLFALALPGWLAVYCGVDYANETVGGQLLLGGALITLANVLMVSQKAE